MPPSRVGAQRENALEQRRREKEELKVRTLASKAEEQSRKNEQVYYKPRVLGGERT